MKKIPVPKCGPRCHKDAGERVANALCAVKQMKKSRTKAAYMISAVAEQYGIHPQTLRMYEREGLLEPSRSEGNTRLYTEEDLERLEVILKLTRDMGVNLAGVEIILNMRARMEAMQRQMGDFITSLNRELAIRVPVQAPREQNSLVPIARYSEPIIDIAPKKPVVRTKRAKRS